MRETILLYKNMRSLLKEKCKTINKLPLNGITAMMGFLTITYFYLSEDKVTASMGGMETDMDIDILDDEIINEIIMQMKSFL